MNIETLIPAELKPKDGRFGSGPSKIRTEQLNYLQELNPSVLGTSHRQPPVKNLVAEIFSNLTEFFPIPPNYEIVIGNGGTTAFWEALAFGVIDQKSLHLSYGEFSAKFAKVAQNNPFIADPIILSAPPGSAPELVIETEVDTIAWVHNETSTGVSLPVTRPQPAPNALIAVDATSAAGGLYVDLTEVDIYYFSGQKCFGAEGGIWYAILSPAAIKRIEQIATSGRWIPDFLSLTIALENSRKNQTYNTPALTTLALLNSQLKWFNSKGGLAWATQRTSTSAEILYQWADTADYATPFVSNPKLRSNVVGTIDFSTEIDAAILAKTLRANGIVDTESYRKLNRNQIRVSMFPAIAPEEIEKLTKSIDWLIKNRKLG